MTAAFAAERETRTNKLSVRLDAIQSTSVVNHVKSDTAQAVRGGVGFDSKITNRVFFNLFNDYEYDLDVLVGADYDHVKFGASATRAGFAESSAEVFFGDELLFKLRLSTAFTQSFRMFNNLTDTGSYRVNGDIGLNTRIMKWLNWNVSLSDRYLSNPAPGRRTNDLVYTTGIGLIFAHK